mgnify:CR=1 FL=1
MEKERSRIQFGIIVSSRNFFPKELAKNGRDAILEKMKEMGFGCIILSPTETPLGVVETYQDAKKCAELFAKHREEIDGIIIVLPNFGDEAAVTEAIVRLGYLYWYKPVTMRKISWIFHTAGTLFVENYPYAIIFTRTEFHLPIQLTIHAALTVGNLRWMWRILPESAK